MEAKIKEAKIRFAPAGSSGQILNHSPKVAIFLQFIELSLVLATMAACILVFSSNLFGPVLFTTILFGGWPW